MNRPLPAYPHPMDDRTGFDATDEEMGLPMNRPLPANFAKLSPAEIRADKPKKVETRIRDAHKPHVTIHLVSQAFPGEFWRQDVQDHLEDYSAVIDTEQREIGDTVIQFITANGKIVAYFDEGQERSEIEAAMRGV